MKIFWKLIIVLSILSQSLGAVWPQPQAFSGGSQATILKSSDFKFQITSNRSSSILEKAFKRYFSLIFGSSLSGSLPSTVRDSQLTVLNVDYSDTSEEFQFGVDESYSLSIDQTSTALLKVLFKFFLFLKII